MWWGIEFAISGPNVRKLLTWLIIRTQLFSLYLTLGGQFGESQLKDIIHKTRSQAV